MSSALAAERLALPPESTVRTGRGGVAVRTGQRPDFGFGNSLHLDEPPPDLGAALEAWDAAFEDDPGPPRCEVHWETATGAGTGAVPAGAVLQTLAVLELDRFAPQVRSTEAELALRPAVDPADWEAVAGLFEEFAWPDAGPGYWSWRAAGYQRTAETGAGTFWLARRGGVPVATAGCFTDGRLTTIQDVVTHRSHRGLGIASTLLTALLAAHRAQHPTTAVTLLVDPGSDAERLYRDLGFRRCGDVHELSAPRGRLA